MGEELVTQALTSAPRSFTLGARVPDNDFPLPATKSGYVLDNGGIYIMTADGKAVLFSSVRLGRPGAGFNLALPFMNRQLYTVPVEGGS